MNDAERAIYLLHNADIPAQKRAYGFSLQHNELANCDFAHCGFDNDGSTSLSVNINEDPPVHWFFRISFVEMATFIISAYAVTGKPKPSREEIVTSMHTLNKLYKNAPLEKMTAKFLGEMESD